jgi:hypothetical protein
MYVVDNEPFLRLGDATIDSYDLHVAKTLTPNCQPT